MNWQHYGSNGLETADYSRGVLERFTRRAPKDYTVNNRSYNAFIKNITIPRQIKFIFDPHHIVYFGGHYPVNEMGRPTFNHLNFPVTAEKIVVNHYYIKSREEFITKKTPRGWACPGKVPYDEKQFNLYDRNEEFDDGILNYRDARAKIYQPPDNSHVDERLLSALEKNLSPTLSTNTPQDFYADKMETFLTCRAVAAYLQTKLADTLQAKFYEEASLKAVLKSLDQVTLNDGRLFTRELPKLLSLPYPVVNELRAACQQVAIPRITGEIKKVVRGLERVDAWQYFVDLDYLQDIFNLESDNFVER